MIITPAQRIVAFIELIVLLVCLTARPSYAESFDQSGTIWGPALEWTLDNPHAEGNRYDLAARVTFTHSASGETRRTGMFYSGDEQWKFRFTGARTGTWTFESTSDSPPLHGKKGVVEIAPATDPHACGFLVAHQSKFARHVGEHGELEAIVPNVRFYKSAVDLLEQADRRPVLLERRFSYLRDDVWDMATTRRAFWQFTLAGGVGAIWGHYPQGCTAHVAGDYPHPEQLRTHRDFWRTRFLIDVQPTSNLSDDEDTLVLASPDGRAVFYREDAESIQLDLSGLEGPQPAIAVDTRKDYAEIDLGALRPGEHTWQAPRRSDWALAIGAFPDRSLPEEASAQSASNHANVFRPFACFPPSMAMTSTSSSPLMSPATRLVMPKTLPFEISSEAANGKSARRL